MTVQFCYFLVWHPLRAERSADCCRVFMEYVPGGSVRRYVVERQLRVTLWAVKPNARSCGVAPRFYASLITQFGGLNESIIRRYIRQVLEAVAHLHANGIVHGNISIDHLLVTSTESSLGCIKLAGFLSAWRIRKDVARTTAYVHACAVSVILCRMTYTAVLMPLGAGNGRTSIASVHCGRRCRNCDRAPFVVTLLCPRLPLCLLATPAACRRTDVWDIGIAMLEMAGAISQPVSQPWTVRVWQWRTGFGNGRCATRFLLFGIVPCSPASAPTPLVGCRPSGNDIALLFALPIACRIWCSVGVADCVWLADVPVPPCVSCSGRVLTTSPLRLPRQ